MPMSLSLWFPQPGIAVAPPSVITADGSLLSAEVGASGFHLFPSCTSPPCTSFHWKLPISWCFLLGCQAQPAPVPAARGIAEWGFHRGSELQVLAGFCQDPADSLCSMLSNPLAAFPCPCSLELVLRNVFLLAQQRPSEVSLPAASRRAWQPWGGGDSVSHWLRGWGSLPVLLLSWIYSCSPQEDAGSRAMNNLRRSNSTTQVNQRVNSSHRYSFSHRLCPSVLWVALGDTPPMCLTSLCGNRSLSKIP